MATMSPEAARAFLADLATALQRADTAEVRRRGRRMVDALDTLGFTPRPLGDPVGGLPDPIIRNVERTLDG